MKRVVTSGELTQRAMRPTELSDTYLAHAEADISQFGLRDGGQARPCPACDASGAPEFTRMGFSYDRCTRCASLYVSPVPEAGRLARYHAEGAAERFRHERMLPITAGIRAKHALGPRAHWVLSTAAARVGGSLAAGQLDADSELLANLLRTSSSVQSLGDVREDTPAASFDVVMAFDTLERAADFTAALRRCRAALKPGGLLFVTTMSGEGFEVRMLGERSRSLVPPVHLQLLSRAGWHDVLGREGFELVEYSTPGELDVQAVAEVIRQDPSLRLPPILDELIRHDDDAVGRAFQEVLQQAGLSAHVQLVAEAKPLVR